MLKIIRKTRSIYPKLRFLLLLTLTIVMMFMWRTVIRQRQNMTPSMPNVLKVEKNQIKEHNYRDANVRNNLIDTTLEKSSRLGITKHTLAITDSKFIHHNKTLETTIECVGSLYNQSCLYRNLYYFDHWFMILTVKGKQLPTYSVRTDAFVPSHITPNKRVFDTYSDLEKFVRTVVDPRVIPSVTVHFGQPWHDNIGHALFDGLYPAYVALIRFPPRHLQPFRILAAIADCNVCWSEDIYSRFGGLGLLRLSVLNKMSKNNWFMFEELIMGSGTFCQRCTQPSFQLPAGVELDASRLFRDRMYQQHGVLYPVVRQKSSSEGRNSSDVLQAYIIDNKRYTSEDRKEIDDAVSEINNYTNSYLNKTTNSTAKLQWPLVRVTYLFYNQIKARNFSNLQVNATPYESRSPTYELFENDFIAQLKLLRQMDIHITGPGTGQMYQTFLSDGSVMINIGGIRPWAAEKTERAYSSYLEQQMTSGTPYIKGLFYPINERQKGIQKNEVVKLIRQASQLILEGFSLPVNPRDNLAPDGQLFVEMCEKDKEFCSMVTNRISSKYYPCLDIWVEDFVHEHHQWQLGGLNDNGRKIDCPFNHTLLHELRKKYGILHKQTNNSSTNATQNAAH